MRGRSSVSDLEHGRSSVRRSSVSDLEHGRSSVSDLEHALNFVMPTH